MQNKMYLLRITTAAVLVILLALPLYLEAGTIGYGTEFCNKCSKKAQCKYLGNGTNVSNYKMECICSKFYEGDGINCTNLDECKNNIDNCDSYAVCTDKDPGFSCACPPGYIGDGVNCNDTNECLSGSHQCHANASCINTRGSYRCQCNTGFTGDGFKCYHMDKCKSHMERNECGCSPGYVKLNGSMSCIDVDECKTGTPCHTKAKCINTPGNYTCQCLIGFTGNGSMCIDIDECAKDKHMCDKHAVCSNTIGSYSCQCLKGFTGNGSVCVDINECTAGIHICHEHAKCQNTEGSYSCHCCEGFTGNGTDCMDIDECKSGSHTCDIHAHCKNINGSFNCTCAYGFEGNGTVCMEKDSYIDKLTNIEKELKEKKMSVANKEYQLLNVIQWKFEILCDMKNAKQSKAASVFGRRRRAIGGKEYLSDLSSLQRLCFKNSQLLQKIEESKFECELFDGLISKERMIFNTHECKIELEVLSVPKHP